MTRTTEIPNEIIDDLNLSVYEFRVYAYLKRWVDEHHQPYDGSTRDLAERTNISAGRVSQAKQALAQHGYIAIATVPTPTGPGHEITVLNRRGMP